MAFPPVISTVKAIGQLKDTLTSVDASTTYSVTTLISPSDTLLVKRLDNSNPPNTTLHEVSYKVLKNKLMPTYEPKTININFSDAKFAANGAGDISLTPTNLPTLVNFKPSKTGICVVSATLNVKGNNKVWFTVKLGTEDTVVKFYSGEYWNGSQGARLVNYNGAFFVDDITKTVSLSVSGNCVLSHDNIYACSLQFLEL